MLHGALCLMVATLVPSLGRLSNDPPVVLAQSPADTMTPAQIGTLVRDRLRSLTALRFEQRIASRGVEYVILRQMTPEAFRSEVYDRGQLIYAIGMEKGKVTEFLAKGAPADEGPAPADLWMTYDAPAPDGCRNSQLCHPDLAFSIRSCLATWIGPHAARPDDLLAMISGCQSIERTLVEGKLCYLASFSDTVPDDGNGKPRSFSNQFFVDPQTGELRQWDSTQQQDGRDPLTRRRTFRKFSTEPIPDTFAWLPTPQTLQRSLTQDAPTAKTASR